MDKHTCPTPATKKGSQSQAWNTDKIKYKIQLINLHKFYIIYIPFYCV